MTPPQGEPATNPPLRPSLAVGRRLIQLSDAISARGGPGGVFATALALSLVLGALDHFTGPELASSIFYVAPVALVAWYTSPLLVTLTCALTAGIWLMADLTAGHVYTNSMIPVWNALVRLGFFLLIGQLLMALRDSLGRERSLANADPLTGLANGRHFYELLERELARARRYEERFTLAFIDADHFKAVNDRWGHAEGDKVLQRIAAVLRSQVRETDVPSRLGGDEFGILFPRCDEALAQRLLPRVQEKLLAAMEEGGWPVGFSVGAVTVEPGVQAAEVALSSADDLMYHVKATGKNAIRYGRLGPEEEKAFKARVGQPQRLVPPPRPTLMEAGRRRA